METTLVYTPVQCPNVLALQQFILAQCGSVNRTLVREVVEQAPRFPLVSLNDLNYILRSWQFDTFAFKATSEGLMRLKGPLLAHCVWPDQDRYFVVIRTIHENEVHYFSPFRGEVREPISSFSKYWTGALLMAEPTTLVESALLWDTDEESIATAAYKRESVQVYPNFFSADECAYIINYAEDKKLFTRSQLQYEDNQVRDSDTRTSYSAFLRDLQHPVFQAIYNRVATLLKVNLNQIEPLQCVRYGEGQQFKPHFDSMSVNHRLHTILVYLNDDFVGGETFFPELNMNVHPKQGSALYFLNRDENNLVLLNSVHAGLPIANGTKYACNIWVRNQPIT
ncbi:2OG-Fe(II) oxygenase [Spirosoma sp. RP8]|uniref:2OG-Fe(II) oxygenase n=2 Tax=Spirosoma liriopis TaxID=2937440 RepID=A0ABT0HSX5_9BACT|nr:2OG-Fe(II) oxygenase [Spirosoma liriopis]